MARGQQTIASADSTENGGLGLRCRAAVLDQPVTLNVAKSCHVSSCHVYPIGPQTIYTACFNISKIQAIAALFHVSAEPGLHMRICVPLVQQVHTRADLPLFLRMIDV